MPGHTWVGARCKFKALDPAATAPVGEFNIALSPYTGSQPATPALPYTHAVLMTQDSTVTAGWPLGLYAIDFEFFTNANPPFVKSTATKRLLIERDIS